MIRDLVEDWYAEVTPLFPQPEELRPLSEGQQIDLGGNRFELIKTGGHSDGQYVLWSASKRHMFGGDMLAVGTYLHFTDWPLTFDANTLATLFAAMKRLKALGEVRVFPGHGDSFTDLDSRLDALKQLHLRRMERVLKAVKAPVRAGDLYTQVAELVDHVHLHRLVLGETLGYLSYLTAQGQLNSREDGEGLWFYCPDL
jgi:glyoxylase-like metal-dependent hydrolase (beta-lactamase superfamily II)